MGLKFVASAHSLSANGTSPLTYPAGWRHSSSFTECQEMLNIAKRSYGPCVNATAACKHHFFVLQDCLIEISTNLTNPFL